MTRRYAIALVLGHDVSDVSAYQPGKSRIPLYTCEAGVHGMAVALRDGEKLPDDYDWQHVETVENYRVYVA